MVEGAGLVLPAGGDHRHQLPADRARLPERLAFFEAGAAARFILTVLGG